MLRKKNSAALGLISLRSAVKIASRLVMLFALAVIIGCLFPPPMHAQGSLSLGTIAVSNVAWSCDPTGGWYYYRNGTSNTYMTCQNAVINCPNTQSMSLSFGVIDPTAVGLVNKTLGTIVILGGDGGLAPGNFGFADSFFRAGYEIVEMTWASDWEQTYMPFTQGETASIQNAACRPATFLNFAHTTFFPAVQSAFPNAGYCAHGASAGSAEIAYSLAYYSAGSWLDYVQLLAGPVFGDIKQGCQVPAPTNVCVCGTTPNCTGTQYGCQLGTGGPWSISPSYLGVAGSVGQWTNDNSCRGTSNTTSNSNQAWLAQSIVDQSTGGPNQGAIPTFNYPSTGMSAWLCRTSTTSMNNSSPQGEIFYANIGQANSPPSYAVYAVDNCPGSEAVGGGNVPGYQVQIFHGTVTGSTAITDDMIGIPPNVPAGCTRRLH